MPVIQSGTIAVQNSTLCCRIAGAQSQRSLLFLHGAAFTSQTWQEIGTLALMAEQGYYVVAIDLPGFGGSPPLAMDPGKVLPRVMEVMGLLSPVVISPSMSGRFSLPWVAACPEQVTGYVAVAPVGIPTYERELAGNPTPTLAVWGENDRTVPVQQGERLCRILPNAELVILAGAGHACYMSATNKFHQSLLAFLGRCDRTDD